MKQPFHSLAALLLIALVIPAAAGGELPLLGSAVLAADDEAQQDATYREGRRALDDERWADAVDHFRQVVAAGGEHADAALYWQAYALNKQGRSQDALATLRALQRQHPASRWHNDARALEIEIRQATGRAPRPEAEDDEELKLLALNALMHVEAERAAAMLDRFLQGNYSQEFKERALFILGTSDSDEAHQIVVAVALGKRDSALRAEAVRILGFSDHRDARAVLEEVYRTSSDPELKNAALHGLLNASDVDQIVAAISAGNDPALALVGVHMLGVKGAGDALRELYRKGSATELKAEILTALALTGDVDTLIMVAENEPDEVLRRAAIRGLGHADADRAGATLDRLWAAREDLATRLAIIDAWGWQEQARKLIRIVRSESDQQLRREAVERLSTMDSEEAVAFMLELLEEK